MSRALRSSLLLLLCALFASAQAPATPSIFVDGAIPQPLTLTPGDLAKLPRASLKTTNDGVETAYEGVWLHDVLKRSGAPQGYALRGEFLASCVIAHAQDGYQVAFSLAETDPAFTDSQILLADTGDGKPLFGAQGRFRLIVATDKPGARSVRMLTRLEIVQLRK